MSSEKGPKYIYAQENKLHCSAKSALHTYIRNWQLPAGAFQGQWNNNWNILNRLRIPTGRRQTSWLCTSAAEELNQGLPRKNPASGQSGTRDLQISSPAPKPLGHVASYSFIDHIHSFSHYYYHFGRQEQNKNWKKKDNKTGWGIFTISNAVRKRPKTLKWLLDFDWLLTLYDYLILTFHWFIQRAKIYFSPPNSPFYPAKCATMPGKMIRFLSPTL